MKNEQKETKHLINEMKCVFPSYSVNESLARSLAFFVCVSGESHGVRACGYKVRGERSGDKRRRSRLPRTIGDITLHMKLYSNREVTVTVRDGGCGITDITRAMEPLFTTDPDNEALRNGLCDNGIIYGQSFGKITAWTRYEGCNDQTSFRLFSMERKADGAYGSNAALLRLAAEGDEECGKSPCREKFRACL